MPRDSNLSFDSIQVLRFIAAIMVVLCHATFYAHERLGASVHVYEQGANGVPLFFAISGFVMIISSRNLNVVGDGWKIFAEKRIIRIIPLYWLLTTVKVLIMLTPQSLVLHSELDISSVIKSYFFIPDYNAAGKIEPILGVGWTLNFEMFFYLLFTLALLFRLNSIYFCGIVLTVLTCLSFFKNHSWPVELRFFSSAIVLNFLMGMIIADLILKRKLLQLRFCYVSICVGLLLLFLPVKNYFNMSLNTLRLFQSFICFLIVYGAASMEFQKKVYSHRLILFFGAASYSMYLIHPMVAPLSPYLLNKLNIRIPLISILLSISLALIATYVIYLFFEKPVSAFLSKKFIPPRVRTTVR